MKNKLEIIIKSKIFKNSMWLFVLKFTSTILPMLTIPYITRILGAEEYGSFSIALNWVLYFQVIVEYGFGLTGARKIALNKNYNNVQKIYNNILSSRFLLFAFSLLLMNIVCFLFAVNLKIYVCMNLLFLMVFGTSIQLVWLFQGMQDMKFITITDLVARIVSILLIFLLVKNEGDIYLYCVLYSITTILSSLISVFLAKKKYRLKFKFSTLKSIKEELFDGKELFASAAATKIFSGIGLTVLGFVTVNEIVGIYSAISKVPLVLTYLFAPISQALYPYCSELFKKNEQMAMEKIKKICFPLILLYMCLSIFIMVFRIPLLLKLFGSQYSHYSIVLIPLLVQFVFAIINNILGIQILVASGRQKVYSKAFIVNCIIMFLLNVVLGYFFNIYGVAIATPIGEILLTILLVYNIKKEMTTHEKN